MNTRLRSSLSTLAIVVFVALGALAAGHGSDTVAALSQARSERGADERPMSSTSRVHLAMPFFSFGRRVSAGVR